MIRRYGEAVKSTRRYTRRPGVYGVLLRGSEVLLTHQAEPIPEYQLPGGGIDKGEAPIAALHREVYEETGWHIGPPRRLGTYRRFTYMPDYDMWAEKVCTIYVARPTLCQGPPSEIGHIAVWTSARVALELLDNVGDRAMLFRAMAEGGL